MRTMPAMIIALMLAACTAQEDPKPAPEAPKTQDAPKADPKPVTAKVSLDIEGMHCDSCAGWVEDILEKLDGVTDAEVSYPKHSAIVTMKPGKQFPEAAARDELDKENYKLKSVAATN